MKNSVETALIMHASPTLAGLKPANLFSHKPSCRNSLYLDITNLSHRLSVKGVNIRTITCSGGAELIFVYRPFLIAWLLKNEAVREFLFSYGYPVDTGVETVIDYLCFRLQHRRCGDFPHELGLFLGYPLDDVIGFIENKGKHFLFCGCWKVYARPGNAKSCFDLYQKCQEEFSARHLAGETIDQLTEAV